MLDFPLVPWFVPTFIFKEKQWSPVEVLMGTRIRRQGVSEVPELVVPQSREEKEGERLRQQSRNKIRHLLFQLLSIAVQLPGKNLPTFR